MFKLFNTFFINFTTLKNENVDYKTESQVQYTWNSSGVG